MPTRRTLMAGMMAHPAGAPDRPEHPGSLIVAPDSPGVREFLRGALLDGLIRTAAAGPGRVAVLPTGAWLAAGSRAPAR